MATATAWRPIMMKQMTRSTSMLMKNCACSSSTSAQRRKRSACEAPAMIGLCYLIPIIFGLSSRAFICLLAAEVSRSRGRRSRLVVCMPSLAHRLSHFRTVLRPMGVDHSRHAERRDSAYVRARPPCACRQRFPTTRSPHAGAPRLRTQAARCLHAHTFCDATYRNRCVRTLAA